MGRKGTRGRRSGRPAARMSGAPWRTSTARPPARPSLPPAPPTGLRGCGRGVRVRRGSAGHGGCLPGQLLPRLRHLRKGARVRAPGAGPPAPPLLPCLPAGAQPPECHARPQSRAARGLGPAAAAADSPAPPHTAHTPCARSAARAEAARRGVANAEFRNPGVAEEGLPAEPTYALVMTHDAIHDMARPDLVMANVRKVRAWVVVGRWVGGWGGWGGRGGGAGEGGGCEWGGRRCAAMRLADLCRTDRDWLWGGLESAPCP
jgi:hypothetical protein